MTKVLLVGNPNCGKTTLFNALTGENQRVGNWAGVTVEKKSGFFSIEQTAFQVIDLPGTYSLTRFKNSSSQDELITAEAITNLSVDCIINVIDACHLERHLYLTSQILELGKPVIVVLNMIDIAKQRGISIDFNALADDLSCPVIPLQAHKKKGLASLENALLATVAVPSPLNLPLDEPTENLLTQCGALLIQKGHSPANAYFFARRLAEGGEYSFNLNLENRFEKAFSQLDILIADARYRKVHELCQSVQRKKNDASEYFTAKLDRVVLNRFWGLPIFFSVMYFMFLFAINIGGAFQDFFDIGSEALFVNGFQTILEHCYSPNWLTAILAHGMGKGINTTLTFIPVIAAMYFFLALLEISGYMARAAFVVDKVMRLLGLPGKAFVPLIVGFGCNVPAIMASRTLDSERDKLLTIMMAPFMSCSARLAIYAVFVAAFFPTGGQNIVFSLYVIGIFLAVFTGFLLRKFLLKGEPAPLILELPAYHKPSLKRLFRETFLRLKYFIVRAAKVIIPVCMIIGALNSITLQQGISASDGNSQSLLSIIGQSITPIFAPMGIHQDNWPATVGLLTGMLAKEVVIGTLNSLYAQADTVSTLVNFNLWLSFKEALITIPTNLLQTLNVIIHPFTINPPDTSPSIYGEMLKRFDGKIGAYAYLLFVLLYIPCVSTVAVIRQEASKKWMWISVVWSFVVAYGVAVAFYQITTTVSFSIIKYAFISLIFLFGFTKYYSNKRLKEPSNAITGM